MAGMVLLQSATNVRPFLRPLFHPPPSPSVQASEFSHQQRLFFPFRAARLFFIVESYPCKLPFHTFTLHALRLPSSVFMKDRERYLLPFCPAISQSFSLVSSCPYPMIFVCCPQGGGDRFLSLPFRGTSSPHPRSP